MSGRRHPNLVGWWMMDGNLSDWSGEGNDGTVGAGSAAYAAGKFGRAWDNDANQRVDFSDNADLRLTGSYTISFWANPRTFGQNLSGRILEKQASGNGYIILFGQFGSVNQALQVTHNTSSFPAPSSSVNLNIWQHFTVTFRSSSSEIIIYKNGEAISSGTISPINSSTSTLYLFNRSDSARACDALLDDIRIYNAALSPSDIQRVYRGQQPARVY